MNFDKIFVIGFNKIATSTFHTLFEKNGLTSQHDGSCWDVKQYQCFSDNGNLRDWKSYARDWPNSLFILNVRPLAPWIRSRAKHCYPEKLRWGYPPHVGLFKKWIEDKNDHHFEVLRFFHDSPERLIVVDISRSGWLEWISGEMGLKPASLSVNEAREGVPAIYIDDINEVIGDTARKLRLDQSETQSPLLCKSLLKPAEIEEAASLLALYRNNLNQSDNF